MDWFKNSSKLFEDQNFGVFVAHKVKEIHNHTTFDDQHYVATEENIADFTTKYQEFLQLINNKNWFYRPDFLQAFECNTFDNSPVLQNNLMNIKNVNILRNQNVAVAVLTQYLGPPMHVCTYGSNSSPYISVGCFQVYVFPTLIRQQQCSNEVGINWMYCLSLPKLICHINLSCEVKTQLDDMEKR